MSNPDPPALPATLTPPAESLTANKAAPALDQPSEAPSEVATEIVADESAIAAVTATVFGI